MELVGEEQRHRTLRDDAERVPNGKPGAPAVRASGEHPDAGDRGRNSAILLAGLVVGAAVLRLVRVGSVPPPLADEVFAAVDIRSLLESGRHFTGATPGILSWIIPALDGRLLVAQLMEPTVGMLRVVSALFGVGTVVLVALVGRELRLPRGGLVAAGALAFMPWHIAVSRVFFPASANLFMTVLAVVSLLAALRKRSLGLAVVSALAAAASIYLYPAGLLTTPALLAAVLVVRRHELRRFGFLGALIAAEVGALAILPYVLVHLRASDPLVTGIDEVIAGKLLWNQGLPVGETARRLLANWASYFTPDFLLLRGDPNVAHSTRAVGSVGLLLGALACAGLIAGVLRRRPEHKILLLWTLFFPLGAAITAVDARGNTIRAVAGSVVWALWAAVGAGAVLGLVRRSRSASVVSFLAGAAALQTAVFCGAYFGPYGRDQLGTFEVGYETVYPTLRREGLAEMPVIFYGGYQRETVLAYFSRYRVANRASFLACYDLPFSSLEQLSPPSVVVVRDDPGFEAVPACEDGSAVRRATARLNALERAGNGRWRVRLVDETVNDEQGRRTAIFFVHGVRVPSER